MTDRPLFILDTEGRWRLAHDSNQWVLQKAGTRRTRRPTQRPRTGRFEVSPGSILDWRGVSFVGGKKSTLARLFREKGIILTSEAQAAMDALPATFLEWLASRNRTEDA